MAGDRISAPAGAGSQNFASREGAQNQHALVLEPLQVASAAASPKDAALTEVHGALPLLPSSPGANSWQGRAPLLASPVGAQDALTDAEKTAVGPILEAAANTGTSPVDSLRVPPLLPGTASTTQATEARLSGALPPMTDVAGGREEDLVIPVKKKQNKPSQPSLAAQCSRRATASYDEHILSKAARMATKKNLESIDLIQRSILVTILGAITVCGNTGDTPINKQSARDNSVGVVY